MMTTLLDTPTPGTSRAAPGPRTHVVDATAADDREPEPAPRELGRSRDDTLVLVGAAASALGIVVLLGPVLHVLAIGWMPFAAFCWFVAVYCVMVLRRESPQTVVDRFWTVLLCAAAVTVLGTLAILIVYVLGSGNRVFGQIFDPNSAQSLWDRLHFFTQDMGGVGPLDGLDRGGIVYAIIGTLIQIGIALVITVPLGLLTAVFLGEVGGRFARIVRTVVEAMTALPSVVAGLFIYATIISFITHEANGFAASLAISILMLPIMIRSADVVLRLVPGNLREAGLALGAGQWSTVWRVVLPTVRTGLVTAVILATAHGIGETAPVLLTSGVTTFTNTDPFHNPMTSLPLAALEFAISPPPDMIARGFATAAVLLVLVLVLFGLARVIAGAPPGRNTPRTARASRHHAERFAERAAAMPLDDEPIYPAPALPDPSTASSADSLSEHPDDHA